ncbi:TPA: ead/Ea22-like family protein [Serratia odorifera]|nr:ead/Ea22-like family protein [Serratia odorifera]
MNNKLSELKAAALAATPGPWFRSGVQFNGITTEQSFITQGNKPHVASASEKRDAIFIAAANPAVILDLLADNEAKDKRISELDYIRASLSQVIVEFGDELNCNPDNESIMMAIDELKEDNTALRDQRAGLAREANRLETHNARLREWNAGLAQESSELQAKLATPVRLPERFSMLHRTDFHEDYHSVMAFKADEVIAALREHGCTVEGDE